VMAYPEGGLNEFVHQLPVRHSWNRITLKQGFVRDPILWQWYHAMITVMGAPPPSPPEIGKREGRSYHRPGRAQPKNARAKFRRVNFT